MAAAGLRRSGCSPASACAHSLADPTFSRRVFAEAPETIAVTGARMAMDLSREFRLNAVMVCATMASSILKGLEEMAAEITEVDLHLLTPTGSSIYS